MRPTARALLLTSLRPTDHETPLAGNLAAIGDSFSTLARCHADGGTGWRLLAELCMPDFGDGTTETATDAERLT